MRSTLRVAASMSAQPFRPDQPFNSLPELPPPVELETKAVLKACIAARAALAELNGAIELVPNPAILINTLPLLEARASSEIENIVTTADRLFRLAALESATADAATKEALRYRAALWRGVEAIRRRPVGTNVAVEICTTLLGIRADVRNLPGTALKNEATGRDVYTPPVGEDRLRGLLANWERFLHDESPLDPLVRMAVAHYQFEAIHPFTDGNGRTGRILNLLYLASAGLLSQPVLYLSRAIIQRKAEYYRLLLDVTSAQQWEPWVLYMVHAVGETSEWATANVRAIRDMHAETTSVVRARAPKIYTRELIDLIFAQPYCRIANVVEAGIAKRQTASTYLSTLAELGVLSVVHAGREKLFLNRDLLDLLS